ncbi:MAG: hypothetical protein V4677_13445 [Bacteroidota bacterium]
MRKLILIFIFFGSQYFLQGQNLSGDYTANDFIKRNATKLIRVSTHIDTITGKIKITKKVAAKFDPKTGIIIIYSPGKHRYYYSTDSLNELYVVDKHGVSDTVFNESITLVPTYSENKHIKKYGSTFYFYNDDHQLTRAMIDTTDRQIRSGWENLFFYKNDVLVKRIDKSYYFHATDKTLSYEADKPRMIIETTYENNTETSFRSQMLYPANVAYAKEKWIKEKTSHTIFTTYYWNGKQTGSVLLQFE